MQTGYYIGITRHQPRAAAKLVRPVQGRGCAQVVVGSVRLAIKSESNMVLILPELGITPNGFAETWV